MKNLLNISIVAVVIGFSSNSYGQKQIINLEDAFTIARANYAGLERDKLLIDQQRYLARAGVSQKPMQIYISGEEFDFENNSGVHSLNFQQNFYLPKVSRLQNEYYNHGAILAEKRLDLTERELKRQIGHAYYQLLFTKLDQDLVAENLELYNRFLSLTETQIETGETGKMPQLAAQSRQGQALLEMEHAEEQHQIASSLFNQWLGTGIDYDVEGPLSIDISSIQDSINSDNPHIQLIIARREQAGAMYELEKTKLFPQINTGFKLQTTSEAFPLVGYQIGIDLPLFNKSHKRRIDAAQLGIQVEEAALSNERQALERKRDELLYRLEHQQHIVSYLKQELEPIVLEQSELNLKAYSEGEIGYLEYLDGLEQLLKVKRQYLESQYLLNVIRIELEYWIGN